MTKEISQYPYGPQEKNWKPYRGTLVRYEGAEHLNLEVSGRGRFALVEFSTESSIKETAAAYEEIFGKRVILPPPPEPVDDFTENEVEVPIVDGPKGAVLVDSRNFLLAWSGPWAHFIDREEETATVVFNQSRFAFDERHYYLIKTLASQAVKEDFDDLRQLITAEIAVRRKA